MIRSLAIVQTAGIMLLAAGSAGAQCPNCDNGKYECKDSGSCPMGSLCGYRCNPAAGWHPPARLPVNRDGIWYHNYWPQAWYGNPGGGFIGNAPMVYQPTDTTQLGYSYTRVPTWRTVRMVPPTPCPAAFHSRICVPRPNCSRVIDGCPAANPCQHGGQNCPSYQQGTATGWSSTASIQTVANAPVHAIHTVTRPTRSSRAENLFSLAGFRKLFD